ncbi:MFS transporter [Geodermatophilus ruber]|uniref:Predicted arabinose efflux permease, MFS family n=1 Tax=Geodermatophilus ruber TaxID=504800 RepID=A0A1I4AEH2_9ACTN|nr:MFS transporter [Geodermatophilus ruber]SFK54166.1 Predicted arabinose efflux permease, MFS family [Geodermatophilus ruber]
MVDVVDVRRDAPRVEPPATDGSSAWAPLRRPWFRALWIAQFVANAGTWAQTVGAQWLMGDLGGSALQIALVQTAATLPVFLLVIPAGALGDVVDRRRLLLLSQTLMLLSAAALAVLTAAGAVTPNGLLTLTALLAVGQALAAPCFQAIQPELVERDELPQAALLNGANGNVARAVGPAIGGLLIAQAGPAAAFAMNAVSFLGVIAVLYRWPRELIPQPLGAEPIRQAIRAGMRYVRSAPAFSSVLARSAMFMVFASGLWALLPALARGPLDLGPNGYGGLLAAVGLGAVVGTVVLPRLRERLGTPVLLLGTTLAYALAVAVVGLATSLEAVVAALVLAGLSWVAVQSTFGATAQLLLPTWARARALAYFQLVFMGGQALGAVAWGLVADTLGLTAAFLLPAGGLVLTALLSLLQVPLRLDEDVRHSELPWPQPPSALHWADDAGPVLVTVEWRVRGSDVPEFLVVMRELGRARRRTGAFLWGVFQDADNPELFLETFTVSTWHEHLRQHVERGTVADAILEERARSFLSGGTEPVVRHLVWAYAVPSALPDIEPEVLPHAHPEPTPSAGPAAADPP